MEIRTEIKPTPSEIAELVWGMNSEGQAEMLEHLLSLAGSEHTLMMQFMGTRDDCEKRGDKALGAFQAMFSSAYKYCW